MNRFIRWLEAKPARAWYISLAGWLVFTALCTLALAAATAGLQP
jgi:hypothetical protein